MCLRLDSTVPVNERTSTMQNVRLTNWRHQAAGSWAAPTAHGGCSVAECQSAGDDWPTWTRAPSQTTAQTNVCVNAVFTLQTIHNCCVCSNVHVHLDCSWSEEIFNETSGIPQQFNPQTWHSSEARPTISKQHSRVQQGLRPTKHIICHIGDGFLWVKWPNQQCQSIEGR